MIFPSIAHVRAPHLAGVSAIVAPLLVRGLDPPSSIATACIALSILAALTVGPANAVGAVAALLPLVFLTARVGGTQWGLLELGLICCAAASGGEIARRLIARRDDWTVMDLLRPIDLTIVAAALLVVGLISLEWVADERASASSQRELRRVVVEPLIVIVAVRLSVLSDLRRLVARCLALGGLTVSAIALGQIGLRSSGVEVGAVFRPIGTYPHPNNLALYLERVLWVPMALGAGRVTGRIAIGLSGLIGLACVASLSRGAIIAILVGGVVWWMLSRKRVSRWVVWSSLPVVVGSLLLARLGGDGTESLDARGRIWQASAEMLRDYPLTGIGIDQFYQLYGTRYVDPGGWTERYTSHPHNLVLDFWLQLGVAGLLLLTGIVWLVCRRARAIRADPVDLVGAAMIAGLAGGFAHGMIDNGFFLPDLATFLWLTLALASPSAGRTQAT